MPRIGVKNLHYAILTSDSKNGVEYQNPVKIAGVSTININPNPSTETLFADDGPFETAATIGQISVEINVAELSLEDYAALLGHTVSNGQIQHRADNVPPWLAIGFEAIKSNGSKRYVWLTKGKFSEPESNNETKGDTINFQTDTITGSFVMREYDKVWKITGDEDSATWSAPTNGWYVVTVLGDVTS